MNNPRSPRSRRRVAILTLSLSAIAACGSSDQTEKTAETVAVSAPGSATTSVPSTTSTTISVSTSTNPATTDVPSTDAEPVEVPFPASALPILETYVMDQPVWAPIGFDDELVFGHGMGIGRLDLDDGSVITAALAAEGDPKAEVFYSVSDGTTYIAVADIAGQGTVDRVTTIDPDTLQHLGASTSATPPVVLPMPASGAAPRIMVASGEDGAYRFDVENIEAGAPLTFVDPLAMLHTNGGELWTWTTDGVVKPYDERDAELGTVETGLSGARFQLAATLVTPTSLWLANTNTAQLVRINRELLRVTKELDLRESFPWADAVRLRTTNTTHRYVLVNATAGAEGWWLLVEIDAETGDVLSEHVLATDAFEYGWNAFDGPEIMTVGDRLFVRDHRRRIVEVDVAALGRPSSTAWTDPGLGRAPVLTDEEQVIAELTLQFVNPGADTPAFTDPVLGPEVADYLAAFRDSGEWDIYGVEVVDDRAAARAGPVSESVGAYFVFRRIDGEWRLDVDELCALALNTGPCAPG